MSCNFIKHHFKTNEEADQALSHMRSIAEQYGYATVRDFHKFIGLAVIPEGSDRYGLSYKDLMEANVGFGMHHNSPGVTERYHYINFPEAHPLYNRAKLWESNPTPNKPAEPLSITIYTEDVDDAANAIAEVFKYVYTIKDRPVHICLM